MLTRKPFNPCYVGDSFQSSHRPLEGREASMGRTSTGSTMRAQPLTERREVAPPPESTRSMVGSCWCGARARAQSRRSTPAAANGIAPQSRGRRRTLHAHQQAPRASDTCSALRARDGHHGGQRLPQQDHRLGARHQLLDGGHAPAPRLFETQRHVARRDGGQGPVRWPPRQPPPHSDE